MVHGVSTLLISAAAGYWVLTHSQREKGRIKTLGQWLGLILIVVSLAGAACKVYYLSVCPPYQGGWMMGGKMCPFGRPSAASSSTTPAQSP